MSLSNFWCIMYRYICWYASTLIKLIKTTDVAENLKFCSISSRNFRTYQHVLWQILIRFFVSLPTFMPSWVFFQGAHYDLKYVLVKWWTLTLEVSFWMVLCLFSNIHNIPSFNLRLHFLLFPHPGRLQSHEPCVLLCSCSWSEEHVAASLYL